MRPTLQANTNVQQVEEHKLAQRVLLELLIFVLLMMLAVVCEFGLEPARRGFFCDDTSIRYPFRPNTVTAFMLALIVLLPPVLILSVGEYARFHHNGRQSERRDVLGLRTPVWLVKSFRQFVYFAFGLMLSFDAFEVAKFTLGRLRPHFMAVCQPQLTDGTTCSDIANRHRYVENYFCVGSGFTVDDVRQARLSFPSGHACLAFYSMTYMALYIQRRTYWRRSELTRHFLQFVLIMVAWFTALSRVMDNWHHWSDVLAGLLIGISVGIITALFIAKLFQHPYRNQFNVLPRQDTSTTLNEVLSTTTPPPYTVDQQTVATFTDPDQYCTKV